MFGSILKNCLVNTQKLFAIIKKCLGLYSKMVWVYTQKMFAILKNVCYTKKVFATLKKCVDPDLTVDLEKAVEPKHFSSKAKLTRMHLFWL